MFFQTDLDDLSNELRTAEENAKKSGLDAQRLADELRQAQDHGLQIEKSKKALENQIKELQVRLDEAEAQSLKGGKKLIQKLEQRVRVASNEFV